MENQLVTQDKPQKVSLIAAMAAKYSMDPMAFQATIKATVMPAGSTNEQMAAFLMVAHEHDLNPITREIYAFPTKGGGVMPMVSIDGWISLANQHPQYDGMEHAFEQNEQGECVSCTCRIFRRDRTRPISVTEFMDECRRQTDPWRSHPRRMLRHRATIQAIRYAFGFSGIKDEDDEVIYASATVAESKPKKAALSFQAPAVEPEPVVPEPVVPEPTNEVQPVQVELEQEQATEELTTTIDQQTGELLDARGYAWDERIHAKTKGQNDDGSWRRLRGVDQELFERVERSLARDAKARQKMRQEVKSIQEPEPVAPEPVTEEPVVPVVQPDPATLEVFQKILLGIQEAGDHDEIDEWLDFARETNLTPDQHAELDAAEAARKIKLAMG